MLVNYIEAYYFQSTENQKRKRVRGNIGWGICKHSLYCLYSSFKVWSYFKIEIKRKKFSQLVSLLPLDQWFSEFFFFFLCHCTSLNQPRTFERNNFSKLSSLWILSTTDRLCMFMYYMNVSALYKKRVCFLAFYAQESFFCSL